MFAVSKFYNIKLTHLQHSSTTTMTRTIAVAMMKATRARAAMEVRVLSKGVFSSSLIPPSPPPENTASHSRHTVNT